MFQTSRCEAAAGHEKARRALSDPVVHPSFHKDVNPSVCSFQGASLENILGPMAQLVRAPPCHGGGRGFESHSGRLSLRRQLGEFPSGQRGQTVNLLAVLSVVRIHLPPLDLRFESLCRS